MIETFGEKPGSERFDNEAQPPYYETTYVLAGSDDPIEVEAYALANIPATRTGRFGVLKRRGITVRHVGHKIYEVDVFYDPGLDDWTFRVSVRGKMQRILVGKDHVESYKHPEWTGEIPKHGALINVRTPDGKPEGIEIPVPCTYLTISKRYEHGVINPNFVDLLDSISFCTNNAKWPVGGAFPGFDEGRLLFLGAELADGRFSPMDVDLNFELGKHLVDEKVNDLTISKRAHDVLWWEEGPKQSVVSHAGTKSYQGKFAHVVRVYDEASYSGVFGF